MAKKIPQPELQLEMPAPHHTVVSTEPEIAQVDLIDDNPDIVTSDLRKFNKTTQVVNKALAPLKRILTIQDDAGVASAMDHLKNAKKVENAIEAKRKDLVKPYNDEVKGINAHAALLSAGIPVEISRVKKLVLDYDTDKQNKLIAARTTNRHAYLLHIGLVRFDKGRAGKVIIDHYYDEGTDSCIYCADLETVSEEVWAAMLNSFQQRRQQAQNASVAVLQEERGKAEYFGEADTVAAIDQKISAAQAVAPRPLPAFTGGGYTTTKTQGLTNRWTHKVMDLSLVPREYLVLDEKKVKEVIAAGIRSIPGLEIFQDQSITIR